MSAKKHIALVVCLAVAGCDPFSDGDVSDLSSSEADELLAAPQYGDVTHISGVFRFYFEQSSIAFCPEPQVCHSRMVSSDGMGCWVIFDAKANTDLDRITGKQNFEHEGDYWIDGKGQIAVQPGYFGHLNAYGCQVRMTNVSSFERLTD